MLLGWSAVDRLAGCCSAVIRLADCLIWLPNLCLAGNPVTRIPDFVQPWPPSFNTNGFFLRNTDQLLSISGNSKQFLFL
jgi:hypothetical protein